MVVVFDGPEEEFWAKMSEVIEKVIIAHEHKKLVPIEKKEACRLLDITYPTLKDRMKKEGLSVIYASDIERLKLKYPKFSRG